MRAKLVQESILKGPSEEGILNKMRKLEPKNHLRKAADKRYKAEKYIKLF